MCLRNPIGKFSCLLRAGVPALLTGLQLLSKVKSCCVSLSLLAEPLETAVAQDTLRVWGLLGSAELVTGSDVAEES